MGAKPIARTTLARLNKNQPSALYEKIFFSIAKALPIHQRAHQFRFKNPLYSLDASAIDLSLSLFPWAAHRDHTANVKLSVGLHNGTHVPAFVALGDGQENDMVQGRQFDFLKGSIVAFDKGYVDYQWFASLTDKGVFFVTRLRAKVVYRVEERRDVDLSKGVLSDQNIQLSSAHAIKRGAPRLRRVGYRDALTGRFYEFLTNNFRLSLTTMQRFIKIAGK